MNVLAAINPRLSPQVVAPDGRWVEMEVSRVVEEEVDYGRGAEQEIVLYVRGQQKGIRLNTTNTKRLVKTLGSGESDDWIGQKFYARGRWVNTPSGEEAFTWSVDDGEHTLAMARQEMAKQRNVQAEAEVGMQDPVVNAAVPSGVAEAEDNGLADWPSLDGLSE